MDPIAIANLLAQLLPVGINLYTQIQQANADKLAPVATILAQADSNWAAILATANAQLGQAPASTPPTA